MRRAARIQSDMQVASGERKRCFKELKRERERLAKLTSDSQALARAAVAVTAVQVWQPTAVCNHHNRLLEQTPINGAAYAETIKQQLMESRLQIKRLENNLMAKDKLRAELKDKLKGVESVTPWTDVDILQCQPQDIVFRIDKAMGLIDKRTPYYLIDRTF